MNSPHPTLYVVTRFFFAMLVFAVVLGLLIKGASGPINAQQPSATQERQVENTIPKHVPIDVKIAKEKEKNWKDLKNENWAKDFELQISNTGDKPIYTFYLLVFFDVPTDFETELIAPIHYGRQEISDPRAKPTEDDVPIKPGETQVFKIHPNILLSWEKGRREKGWRLPTRVRIKLESLTFGDGTGLMFSEGVPYPRSTPKVPQRNSFSPGARGKRDTVSWPSAIQQSSRTQGSTNHLPAFQPVNYFEMHSESAAADTAVAMEQGFASKVFACIDVGAFHSHLASMKSGRVKIVDE